MIQALAKIALAGPLTVYYGYRTDNRLVRYGMYALGAGIVAQGVLALYRQTRTPVVQSPALQSLRTFDAVVKKVDTAERVT